MEKNTLSQRIRNIREILGLSQNEFANKINRTSNFIAQIESGRSNISEKTKTFDPFPIINWYNLRANKDSDVLNLIKSENMEIYDFNELVEYYYDLNKINLKEIFLKNLVSSSGRIM